MAGSVEQNNAMATVSLGRRGVVSSRTRVRSVSAVCARLRTHSRTFRSTQHVHTCHEPFPDAHVVLASYNRERNERQAGIARASSSSSSEDSTTSNEEANAQVQCPRWLLRSCFALVTTGQVVVKIFRGKIHFRNVLEQLANVGPKSLSVCLLTSCFVGMVFTIQVSMHPLFHVLFFSFHSD